MAARWSAPLRLPGVVVLELGRGGHLKHLLPRAKLGALGLPCPTRRPVGWRAPDNRLAWANFHTFRHTWATWMRRYGGLDTKGLVATKSWRDERSAGKCNSGRRQARYLRALFAPFLNLPQEPAAPFLQDIILQDINPARSAIC